MVLMSQRDVGTNGSQPLGKQLTLEAVEVRVNKVVTGLQVTSATFSRRFTTLTYKGSVFLQYCTSEECKTKILKPIIYDF
jgi:hypothetical protein